MQWGQEIGKHEAIAHKLADMAGDDLRDGGHQRPRARARRQQGLRHPPRGGGRQGVEHRARPGEIVDDTMQIRGGRGYETAQSLAARGEEPIGVERAMRDSAST